MLSSEVGSVWVAWWRRPGSSWALIRVERSFNLARIPISGKKMSSILRATGPASRVDHSKTRAAAGAFRPEAVGPTVKKEAMSPPPFVITYESVRGRSRSACVLARYVRELRRRAPSPLCVRRDHDDGRPGDDDAPLHGAARQPGDGAHWPNASVTLPWRYSSEPAFEKGCAGCDRDMGRLATLGKAARGGSGNIHADDARDDPSRRDAHD
jgi:hypothetical protein